MAKIIVIYYSKTGNTKRMAELVEEGVKKEKVPVVLKSVAQLKANELLEYDGIIMGSPTYYGSMAFEMKELLDSSVSHHGRLEGKVGGAFSSAANIGGGNETTVLSILQAMLIHGMVIQGTSYGDHYGPVAIEAPDERAEKQCIALGQRVAKLVKQIAK